MNDYFPQTHVTLISPLYPTLWTYFKRKSKIKETLRQWFHCDFWFLLNMWSLMLCRIRKNRMFVLTLIVLGFSWETIRSQRLQNVQKLYQTNMMSLHRNIWTKGNGWWQMKHLSMKWNHLDCWTLQSLIVSQCHEKEHIYVNNEAGPQRNSITHGRLSCQI